MANIKNNTTTINSILETVQNLPEAGSGGITPAGTIDITENGEHNVTNYANANVNVPMPEIPEAEELDFITPSDKEQTFPPEGETKLYSKVVIKAVDEDLVKSLYPNMVDTTINTDAASASYILYGKKAYVNGSIVTGDIAYKSSDSLTAVNSTVYVPKGYYSSQAEKSIDAGELSSPDISVSSSGVITAISGVSTAGYLDTNASKPNTMNLTTNSGGTYTLDPGEGIIVAAGTYLTDTLNVTASKSSGGVVFGDFITGERAGGTAMGSAIYQFNTGDTSKLAGFYIYALTSGGMDGYCITAGLYDGNNFYIMALDSEPYSNYHTYDISNITINSTSIVIASNGEYFFERTPKLMPIYSA